MIIWTKIDAVPHLPVQSERTRTIAWKKKTNIERTLIRATFQFTYRTKSMRSPYTGEVSSNLVRRPQAQRLMLGKNYGWHRSFHPIGEILISRGGLLFYFLIWTMVSWSSYSRRKPGFYGRPDEPERPWCVQVMQSISRGILTIQHKAFASRARNQEKF